MRADNWTVAHLKKSSWERLEAETECSKVGAMLASCGSLCLDIINVGHLITEGDDCCTASMSQRTFSISRRRKDDIDAAVAIPVTFGA
jgi:hypothetical protein